MSDNTQPQIPPVPTEGTVYNPYKPPEAHVADPRRIGAELPKARRLTRLAAQFVNALVYVALILIVGGVGGLMGDSETSDIVVGALAGLGGLALLGLQLFFLHRDGQSLGKKALGVKIVRNDGSRASLARLIFIRYLPIGLIGAIPIVGGLVSLINFLLIFGQEKMCGHDHLADTQVVEL